MLLLTSAAPLLAKTIKYPKENPLFTIDVPAGWQVHYEGEGPLTIQTSDAAIVAVFDARLKGMEDAATAKQALAVQKKATAETTGFTDFREITAAQKMQLSPGITAIGAQYHAKFPTGEPCIYTVAIFSPNGSDYCSAEFSIKARGLVKRLDEQRQAMIESITPLDSEKGRESDDDDAESKDSADEE